MYAISLTSIPPRFGRLGPVLDSLLAQRPAPAAVYLCLPRRYRRFAGPVVPPALPRGVETLRTRDDFGPATKLLGVARMGPARPARVIYCDDDWIMPPGWAAALLAAQRPGEAVAVTGFDIARLGRQGAGHGAEHCDIAQGYSGVLVDPGWFAGDDCLPPDPAWAVDDIWLSGLLARQGIAIRLAPAARQGLRPAFDDTAALQDARIGGRDRDQANRTCAALLHDRYGIWPGTG